MNTELNDNLGNFINRSLKFITQNFEGKIPEPTLLGEDEKKFIEQVEANIGEYLKFMEKVKIREALQEVMKLSYLGNKYFQDQKVRIFSPPPPFPPPPTLLPPSPPPHLPHLPSFPHLLLLPPSSPSPSSPSPSSTFSSPPPSPLPFSSLLPYSPFSLPTPSLSVWQLYLQSLVAMG